VERSESLAKVDAQTRKQYDYLRATGRPTLITGPEVGKVIRKVRTYKARGMSFAQMDRQTGVPYRTISSAIHDNPKGMHRSVWTPLANMRFEEPDDDAPVSPVGTIRRLGALWVDGFPLPWLSQETGLANRGYLQKMQRQVATRTVKAVTARNVAELYRRLETANPVDLGIPLRTVRYCRTFAKKKGCAPRGCWDVDTIDDPQAQPEWTGACGTAEGWRIHKREDIPVCLRCKGARDAGDLAPNPETGFSPSAFRRLREARGLSRRQLCDKLGMDESSIFYWETGRSTPRQRKLDLALQALGATFEDVCESEES
jgi:DNA-binding XRE family transcriptional regulator